MIIEKEEDIRELEEYGKNPVFPARALELMIRVIQKRARAQ